MKVRCGCGRTLKKDDIRREQVWSKREGKAKTMKICKNCGSILKQEAK